MKKILIVALLFSGVVLARGKATIESRFGNIQFGPGRRGLCGSMTIVNTSKNPVWLDFDRKKTRLDPKKSLSFKYAGKGGRKVQEISCHVRAPKPSGVGHFEPWKQVKCNKMVKLKNVKNNKRCKTIKYSYNPFNIK